MAETSKKQHKIDRLINAPERLSRKGFLIFISVFALIGLIILIKSLAAPNPALPGDLNNDNTVNVTDMSILLSDYGTSNAAADINGDGTVNVLDLSILLSHYGQSITASKPSIPTGLTVTPGDSQVALKWNANPVTDSVDNYQVYWTTDSTWTTGTQQNLAVTGTSYSVTGLTNGTVYYFRVSAHNSAGYGDWSAAIPSTPQGTTGGGGGTPNLTVDGTWENGLGTFTGVECPNPSTQFAIVSSPVREGTHAAYVHETPADIWTGNNIVRCLHADYNSGETVGNDYYYRLSVYLPQRLNGNLIWELHHPASLYNLTSCGVAPFAINSNGTGLTFRISTGNCTVGSGYAEWEPNISIPNLTSQPLNTWIDFAIHIKFTEASTGSVEVYDRIGNGSWGLQISRSNIPTMPYCNSANVHNVVLYTEMGLYVGATGYTNTDTVYLDDYHRESSLAAVENY